MIPEKGDTMSYEGRALTDYEQEAWSKYEAVLDDYDTKCNVKMYDRVSVHELFPEIKAAFDHACAMGTFYRLKEHNE